MLELDSVYVSLSHHRAPPDVFWRYCATILLNTCVTAIAQYIQISVLITLHYIKPWTGEAGNAAHVDQQWTPSFHWICFYPYRLCWNPRKPMILLAMHGVAWGFEFTRSLMSWSLFWTQWDIAQKHIQASCMVLCWIRMPWNHVIYDIQNLFVLHWGALKPNVNAILFCSV